MFERGPFRTCQSCGTQNLGVLAVGGETLSRRCTYCRYCYSERLPRLDKKVIYLDQFAISEIFKVKSGTRRPEANSRAFWEETERLISRALLLQQAIFPDSNIHMDETVVSRFSAELSLAHEMLGGDVSFQNSDDIVLAQALDFLEAFLAGHPPPRLNFNLDDILVGERNVWLRDLHISANMDFSPLADATRAVRDGSGSALTRLAVTWAQEKAPFTEVLVRELESYGRAHAEALVFAIKQIFQGVESGDTMAIINGTFHGVYRQFVIMTEHLERKGMSADDAKATVLRFWKWSGNRENPNHRISAYLFAAAARKMASGQKKPPSRGFFNDVTAVSIYAPYVDAIFVDNEVAAFLTEEPLRSDVKFHAKVFSMNRGEKFLDYLRELEAGASAEIRAYAEEAYGLV